MKLEPCPHCRKPVEFVEIQGGYAIVCSDHNCLGGMDIHYGWKDDREIFKNKLISNWNKRTPEVRAVNAAVECSQCISQSLFVVLAKALFLAQFLFQQLSCPVKLCLNCGFRFSVHLCDLRDGIALVIIEVDHGAVFCRQIHDGVPDLALLR